MLVKQEILSGELYHLLPLKELVEGPFSRACGVISLLLAHREKILRQQFFWGSLFFLGT